MLEGTTMSPDEVRELLDHHEGETLDFKEAFYDLDDPASLLHMMKDVICMANVPRDHDAHIVVGVRKHEDGSCDLVGVKHHPDDAEVQRKLRGKMSFRQ